MNKKVSVDIQCDDLNCIDIDNGKKCDHLSLHNPGAYCRLFDEDLEMSNGNNCTRCIKCRKAELAV